MVLFFETGPSWLDSFGAASLAASAWAAGSAALFFSSSTAAALFSSGSPYSTLLTSAA